jgi:hypothetical protein
MKSSIQGHEEQTMLEILLEIFVQQNLQNY